MIDTHAHLQDKKYEDVKKIVDFAKSNGVENIICASSNLVDSDEAIKIANLNQNIFATIGIHPENANDFDNHSIWKLKEMAKNPKVVAIGEIGLDYCHEFADRQTQKNVFVEQIKLSHELKLPIVIHSRDASQDTMNILMEYKNYLDNGVCIHCFSMSKEILKQVIKMGFFISMGGLVTFKNSKNAVENILECPLENLMLETDCPYLAPEPIRGSINEPSNVLFVAKKIADLKGLSLNEIDRITTQNAIKFFNLEV